VAAVVEELVPGQVLELLVLETLSQLSGRLQAVSL
jgi:hypothetical protein